MANIPLYIYIHMPFIVGFPTKASCIYSVCPIASNCHVWLAESKHHSTPFSAACSYCSCFGPTSAALNTEATELAQLPGSRKACEAATGICKDDARSANAVPGENMAGLCLLYCRMFQAVWQAIHRAAWKRKLHCCTGQNGNVMDYHGAPVSKNDVHPNLRMA